ncbi:DNA alkylation repair protein [Lysobacter korlensis]|uniref:DNA alkylation repair protein n=1 Tax=Lysobacter korlensis TaxID=553636 RepID=A0ABV6RWV0_9GAMM
MTTADDIVERLQQLADETERAKILKRMPADQVVGVRMKLVFDLAKTHTRLPLDQVEALLESHFYEARIVAVSILDFRARSPRITPEERAALFELYLRRHDRIDTWDLVDRAAPRVVGWYLLDKPRDVLYELAASPNIWERRTAITAAFWLIRAGDVDDALRLADRLLEDEPLIQTSVGTALREIGRVDTARLDEFLDRNADRISATTRRMATVDRRDSTPA